MPPIQPRRLAIAVLASAVLVATAPFVGEIRSQIKAAFPGHFSTIIYAIVAAAALAAIVTGLRNVRQHRVARYAAIALAVAVGAVFELVTGSRNPDVFSVELFHFIEYGTITFLFYRVWRDRGDWSALIVPAAAAFIVGAAEEGYQWFLPARVGELKDVWLNGVVIVCGLLFALGASPPSSFRYGWGEGSGRLTARALSIALLALAGFVHVVHLGVHVEDSQAGVFESYYRADELAALDRARAAAWKRDPPLVRPARFSREDQFATEGLQHVQARNKAWEGGNYFAAWRENLILERYYPSMLDTPSYVSETGHRWSPEHRADAAARAQGTEAQPFTSAAYPYPIYVWPPEQLWFGPVLAAIAAWLPWRRRRSARA